MPRRTSPPLRVKQLLHTGLLRVDPGSASAFSTQVDARAGAGAAAGAPDLCTHPTSACPPVVHTLYCARPAASWCVKSRSLCRLLVKAGQWPRACPGGISLCPSAAGGVAFVERRLDFCTRAGWWDRVSSSKIQERRETLRESERIRDRKRSSNTQLAKWLDYYVIFFYNIFRDLSRADPNPTRAMMTKESQ
jgi:hypothetical protein